MWKIEKVKGRRPVYRPNPGKCYLLPAYLELDGENKCVRFGVNKDVNTPIPETVYNGMAIRIVLSGNLKRTTCKILNKFLADHKEQFAQLSQEYSKYQDGSVYKGKWSDKGKAIIASLTEDIDRLSMAVIEKYGYN
jgi:hypothetical protein